MRAAEDGGMTTPSKDRLVLGPLYLEDEKAERERFLDQAALAALPVAAKYWNALRGSRKWNDVTGNAAADAYQYADAVLAERDRRKAGK